MKLRLKADSVRLRLGPAEVDDLARTGLVTAATHFGPAATLAYSLAVSPDAAAVTVAFSDGHLRVTLPAAAARRWAAAADQVSVRGDQDAGDGRRLSVLIEKDFECLHGEDAADDAFPNPERSGTAASKGLDGA